jgi:hypothetical protein
MKDTCDPEVRIKMKYLLPMTVLALFFLLTPVSHSTELQERFIDREYGYSIQHPSSWKANIYRSGIVLADINSSDNKSGLQIRMTHSKKSLDQFIDQYIHKLNNDMQASLMDKTQTMIGYVRVYTITFKSNRGGKDYFLKSYILPVKNRSRIYIFQAGTPFEMKSQIEPILDSIADSFRLE